MKQKYTCILFTSLFLFSLFGFTEAYAEGNNEKKSTIKNLRGSGIGFTENKGQLADMNHQQIGDVLFKGECAGGTVYLRRNGLSYIYTNFVDIMRKVDERFEELEKSGIVSEENEDQKKQELIQKSELRGHRIDVEFIGADLNDVSVVPEEKVEGYQNFYYAHCPQGVLNVKQFNKVTYKNIYKNIDAVYYGSKANGLEYDLVVKPGSDYRQIKLLWRGADTMYLSEQGSLKIKTSVNTFEETIPSVYQLINGSVKTIKANYILHKINSNGISKIYEISFKLGEYDDAFPLIIDPWVTYYGGSGNNGEKSGSVANDLAGNILFTGYTNSTDFPVSPGAFQTAVNSTDAFVVKLDKTCNRLWATYYGGSSSDAGYGISTDQFNNVLFCGYTGSSDFPSGNAGGSNSTHQNSYGGFFSDGFLVKLNPSGARMWSTFYGGASSDYAHDCGADLAGNVFLYGYTESTNNISSGGSFQSALNGNGDLFVSKFNSTGTRLWGTYFGGMYDEYSTGGITCDPSGIIYFSGYTSSPDFPVSPGAYQSTAGGILGGRDALIVKMDGSGNRLWATYYGGASDDEGDGIALDGLGNIIMGGCTKSTANIATPGAYQTSFVSTGANSQHAFIVKFNSAGARQWGTYLGGTINSLGTASYEELSGVATDVNNNVIAAGDTYAVDFPVTSCAAQGTFAGSEDQFLTVFDPTGTKLICSTYVGGANASGFDNESGNGPYYNFGGSISVSGPYVYLLAESACSYPVTSDAYQPVCGGGYADITLAQICIAYCGINKLTGTYTASQTSVCPNIPIDFNLSSISCDSVNTSYLWTFQNGNTGSSTAQNPKGVKWTVPGNYNVSVKIMSPCDTITVAKSNYITITSCSTLSSSIISSDVVCNGDVNGSATVTALNGTANYTYSWSTGATAITSSTTNMLSGLSAGIYSVTVTDGSMNTATSSITITEPPVIVINALNFTNATCVNNNGSANATATGGTGALNYSWSNGMSGTAISGLLAGTYTVSVTDQSGCLKTQSVNISNSPAPTVNSITPTDILCRGNATGAAAVSASGTGTLTYSWSSGASGSTVSGLTANIYTVTVTDQNGCQQISNVTITEPSAITINPVNVTDATCGASNGSATTTATGGTGVLTYGWSNGVIGQTASNLSANTYTLTVSDANTCLKTTTVTINNISGPSATASIITPIGCNNGTGSISVSPTGGNLPYTYSWNNSATGQTINVGSGTYIVTVTDNNGCAVNTTITINEPSTIVMSAIIPGNASCGSSNGTALANASGGTGTLTFSWSNGVMGNAANGLSANTYTVSVTDQNGCVTTQSVNISNSPAPTINSIVPANVLCKGTSTGSATVSATGSGTLSYSWSSGGTSLAETNLSANTYTVTVTDQNGCKQIGNLTITEPSAITINPANVTDASCGASNGSATITATGGTGALTYSWSSGVSGTTVSALAANTYTVSVTDQNSCVKTTTVTINNTSGPAATTSVSTVITCNGANGKVSVSPTGGSSPYTYSWNTSATSQTANVSAGTYTVTVTDNNGCATNTTITITEPAAITINPANVTDASCGASNGSATTTATGGTGGLTYSWSNGFSGMAVSGLFAGNYTLTVTDQNGCNNSITANINNSGGPTITSVTAVDALCSNSTGSASVTASGGTGTLTYSWSNGLTSLTSQISNLAAGTYSVTVSDQNGCNTISTITITAPSVISTPTFTTISPGCSASNGTATVNTTGGTGALTYSWSNGDIGNTAINLSAGTYTVTVTDQNGCNISQSVNINNNPMPNITAITAVNVLCNGNNTGSAVASANGTGTLIYSWSNGVSGATVSGLTANTYTVTVSDQNGCQALSNVTITEPSALTSPTFISTNANCGSSTGSATASVSGGTLNYTFAWSNGENGSIASALTAGTYTLTVTDANGCIITSTVTINNNGAPSITSISPTNILCKGINSGAATVTASGGTGMLTFSWSNGSTGATASGLTANTYTVTVTDQNNCSITSVTNITEPATSVSITSITSSNTNCGISTGSATANVTGGTPNYTYSWSNGFSGTTVLGLAANTYTVTVIDQNGCTTSSTTIIGTNAGPSITSIAPVNLSCSNSANGSATVAISSGSAPYTYSWSTGASSTTSLSTQQLANLSAATYTVTITDNGGCSVTTTTTLTAPATLTLIASTQNATCALNTGSMIVTTSGGIPNYTYSWSNNTVTLNDTLSNLTAGVYTVTVKDQNNCTATVSDSVKTTSATTITIVPAQQTITEGNSVALNVSGGVTYSWSPGTGLNCSNCSSPTAAPAVTTTYTITATDVNGCIITGMITITVKPPCVGNEEDIFIANLFSPNNDGINDILNIEGNGLINIYWAIYDRWGNLLFETQDQTHGWDGTKKGNAMEAGTYVYYLKATCIKTNTEVKMKGNVTIVR